MSRPGLAFAVLALFALELLTHATLLRLPYYWDEAGYYIPAAYDFFRRGTLIPYSTLTNAHPPLLSLYLAAAWKLFGFRPLVTRAAMCLAAACSLAAVYRLGTLLLSTRAAIALTLLAGCYPVCFAQASLAHADCLAAPFTLWGIALALQPRSRPAALALCFSGAALSKEIAAVTPLALALCTWLWPASGEGERPRRDWPRIAALLFPLLPLAAWFGYHRLRTGFAFGNPEYLRYNAASTLEPARIALACVHRLLHLTAHLNLFVPVAVAVGSLLLPVLPGRQPLTRPALLRIWAVLLANGVAFSVLGGALLTRYLLPMYPLVLLLCMAAVVHRLRRWAWFPLLSAAAFLAALLLPTPYRIAPEDTLAYRDAVQLEQQAIALVVQRYPGSHVLTAWPVTDGLRKPELGYVGRPVSVVAVDNFSPAALAALRHEDAVFSTAIVFSTKYGAHGLPFGLDRWDRASEERWFGLHHDLAPEQIAGLLGGRVVWQAARGNQWIAVLRFDGPQAASL